MSRAERSVRPTATIDDLIAESRALTAEIVAFARPLKREVFLEQPGDAKWSVGEHVAHLSLTTRPYLIAIDAAVARARERGQFGDAPYRGTLIGRWFLGVLEPPPRMNVKTLRHLEPARDLDPAIALADFGASQDEFVASLECARGVDLGRARMRSPFFPLLQMAVIESYRVVLAHDRRHLWLMRRVLEALRSSATR